MQPTETHVLRAALRDVRSFSRVLVPGRVLRGYQESVARAVVESVRRGLGMEYAAVFSRQSGKDEMLAQLCAYLLCLYQRRGGKRGGYGNDGLNAIVIKEICQQILERFREVPDFPKSLGKLLKPDAHISFALRQRSRRVSRA